jgi:hypothetical protein
VELFETYHSGDNNDVIGDDNNNDNNDDDNDSDDTDGNNDEESVLDYGTDSSIEIIISSNSNSD